MAKGKRAADAPRAVRLEKSKKYLWCSCGHSLHEPFCICAHVITDLHPLEFVAQKDEVRYICMCKQTNTPPYCDSSHLKKEVL